MNSNPFEKLPEPIKSTKEELKQAIVEAVKKDCTGLKKAALLFSGGVDSTLLAVLMKNELDLKCYCAGMSGSPDLEWAEKISKELGLRLKTKTITEEELEQELPKIVSIVGPNLMKVGVATPFYFCMRGSKEKNFFSGLGTEELYAGYQRHLKALEQEGLEGADQERKRGLKTMWERDLTRDLALANAFDKKLKTPFLHENVVARSLGIPIEKTINKDSKLKKLVLRDIAQDLGAPESVVQRPKKAAQYGSRVDKAMRKIAKREGLQLREYLKRLN
mgnify:CR=1 FL=1